MDWWCGRDTVSLYVSDRIVCKLVIIDTGCDSIVIQTVVRGFPWGLWCHQEPWKGRKLLISGWSVGEYHKCLLYLKRDDRLGHRGAIDGSTQFHALLSRRAVPVLMSTSNRIHIVTSFASLEFSQQRNRATSIGHTVKDNE